VLLEGLAGRVPSSRSSGRARRAYIHKFDQTRNADFVAKAATSVDRAKRSIRLSEVDVTAGVLQTRREIRATPFRVRAGARP
jgi:hypothetical protein